MMKIMTLNRLFFKESITKSMVKAGKVGKHLNP